MSMSEKPIQEDDFGQDSTTLGPASAPEGVPAGSPAPSEDTDVDGETPGVGGPDGEGPHGSRRATS
jgi:hypothetical protein